jgi:hypothetical protein
LSWRTRIRASKSTGQRLPNEFLRPALGSGFKFTGGDAQRRRHRRNLSVRGAQPPRA